MPEYLPKIVILFEVHRCWQKFYFSFPALQHLRQKLDTIKVYTEKMFFKRSELWLQKVHPVMHPFHHNGQQDISIVMCQSSSLAGLLQGTCNSYPR